MTSKKNYILLIIICIGITINAFSQTKQITEVEYYQSYRAANEKRLESSSRNVSRREFFKDGKSYITKDIKDEFMKPNKKHYLQIEKSAEGENKEELIQIGEKFYCRTGNDKWKQSSSWCLNTGISGISNIVSSKFTVEDTIINNQNAKLYQRYTTYKNIYSPDKDKEGLSYWESKFWVNKAGFILREESKEGLLEPVKLYRQEISSYEYNPKNLKIEAPIK